MKHTISKQSYIRAVKGSLLGVFALLVLFHGSIAHANTPTLTLTPTGDGHTVQINIYGDSNASVILNYTDGAYRSVSLGTTNSNGYLSTTIQNLAYPIPIGSLVYVTTTSNGYTSTSQSTAWPNYAIGGTGLTFSQNNINLSMGQSVSIVVSGGNGIYTITNNSNPNLVQATTSSNSIILTSPYNNQTGSATITVCSTYTTSMCGSLYVTVGNNNSGTVSFSQVNPTLAAGQTASVSVYGGTTNSYFISSNSNSNAINATITNNTITLIGNSNAGSASIVVCVVGNSGNCGTLIATSTGYGGGNTGSLVLSQTNLSLAVGQSSAITISGSGSYYISTNTNQLAATTSVSGNTLTVYAGSVGTTTITICQYSGQCGTLYVTVGGTNPGTAGNSYLTLSPANPTLSIGQTTTVYISGGQGGNYTIPYSSSPAVIASISGNTISITGRQNGYAVLVVCDAYSDCGPLVVAVGGGVIVPPIIINPAPGIFVSHLYLGLNSSEVLQLQQLLTTLGIYSGSVDGHFGLLTQQAVKRYQALHGLRADGDVGPGTRAQLNTGR